MGGGWVVVVVCCSYSLSVACNKRQIVLNSVFYKDKLQGTTFLSDALATPITQVDLSFKQPLFVTPTNHRAPLADCHGRSFAIICRRHLHGQLQSDGIMESHKSTFEQFACQGLTRPISILCGERGGAKSGVLAELLFRQIITNNYFPCCSQPIPIPFERPLQL